MKSTYLEPQQLWNVWSGLSSPTLAAVVSSIGFGIACSNIYFPDELWKSSWSSKRVRLSVRVHLSVCLSVGLTIDCYSTTANDPLAVFLIPLSRMWKWQVCVLNCHIFMSKALTTSSLLFPPPPYLLCYQSLAEWNKRLISWLTLLVFKTSCLSIKCCRRQWGKWSIKMESIDIICSVVLENIFFEASTRTPPSEISHLSWNTWKYLTDDV